MLPTVLKGNQKILYMNFYFYFPKLFPLHMFRTAMYKNSPRVLLYKLFARAAICVCFVTAKYMLLFPLVVKEILSPGGGGADHSSQLVGHPSSCMVETKIIFAIPLCNRGVGVKKSRGLANTIKNKF